MGSDEYRSQCLLDIIAKLRQDFERVAELDDQQLEMCFLQVIMRTKVVHLLRGLYPSEGLEFARAFDLMLRAGVCHAAGVDVLSDVQFSIARLPLKSGGCGLGFAEDMVNAAYVATMEGSWQEMFESIPGLDIILVN